MASPLPTVIDYSTIKSLHISFQNTAMSFHYSDDAQLFAEFFDDNGIDLDENLHEHLVENVKICLETNTLGDYRRIPLLQQKMFYRYQCPKTNAFKGLRTDEHLKQAFNDAIETNRTSLHVIVMTDNLFFLPTFSGANLDHIHESEDDLNDAIADAITNATAVPPVISAPAFSAPIGSSSSAAITQPAPVPENEFRHHLLPPDVKKRYDDHQNTDKIVPVSDLVPFVATSTAKTPLNYFHETYIAGDKVILRNGQVLSSRYDSKRFHRTYPTCTDVTFHGLRVWYRLFSGHGNACGIYIVPYELLDKNHGGAIGFTFTDDLPEFKSGYYFDWQNDILRALQHSTMFPADSWPAQRARGHNGYYAVLAILSDSHPAFIEHPITLCLNWPHQKANQTIFDFHAEFTEAIQLRAIFMDEIQDLNSPTMLSTFMHNCAHSAFLLQASRLDSIDPKTSHRFSPGTLAITLNTYLARPDSPRQAPPIIPASNVLPGANTPARGSSSRFREGNPNGYRGRPFQRRVNALGEEEDDAADDNAADLDPAAFEPYMDAIIQQLNTKGPELRHCMFCGPDTALHMFDKCPILNDKRFSTTMAIRLGSTYQRTLKEAIQRQKEAHSGGTGHVPGGTPTPPSDRRRPSPRDTDPLAARIHQLFDAPATPSVPLHPDFLSPDFVPGQPPDFP
jgi:hypothetical protein